MATKSTSSNTSTHQNGFHNDDNIKKLCKMAREMTTKAYAPYSNVHVGAAILCLDNTIITGCNVENASYGLTICAERNALTTAVAQGHRKFTAIAIASNMQNVTIPCGACRQFLIEFGADWDVYCMDFKDEYHVYKVKELLPLAFVPSSMENLHSIKSSK